MIQTKRDYLELAFSGLAGNVPVMFRSPADIPTTCRVTKWGLRAYRVGKPMYSNLPRAKMEELWTPEYYVSESVPLNEGIFQAEVTRHLGGRILLGSGLCRDVHHNVSGTLTKAPFIAPVGYPFGTIDIWTLINAYLPAEDVVMLKELFDQYDTNPVRHLTIEVGLYQGLYGVEQRRTLIWEIRHY